MSGLKFENEIYLSDREIELQLIASGIDMKIIPLKTLIAYVREYAPRMSVEPDRKRCQISVQAKNTEFYYENIYFAAKSGNKKLLNLFLNTGYSLSYQEKNEIDSIMNPRRRY